MAVRNVPTWSTYYMDLAKKSAERSKDPNTQVGAFLVDRFGSPISAGYNGFLPGFPDTDENWERPRKYDLVVHAELNAVAHAARRVLQGSTLYVTAMPCRDCMKAVLASGITEIHAGPPLHGWDDSHKVAYELTETMGIKVVYHT